MPMPMNLVACRRCYVAQHGLSSVINQCKQWPLVDGAPRIGSGFGGNWRVDVHEYVVGSTNVNTWLDPFTEENTSST